MFPSRIGEMKGIISQLINQLSTIENNKFRSILNCIAYSVMQSNGNSFGGDIVLDSFSKAYRVEDSI